MRKLTLLLCALLAGISLAVAQTSISGTVLSAENDEPVIGASEDSKIYKNIKNLSTEELALKASKQQEISLLQNLIRNYQDRIDLLQQELGQYKSE